MKLTDDEVAATAMLDDSSILVEEIGSGHYNEIDASPIKVFN